MKKIKKKEYKQSNKSGVTLIALVITIIVLLLLAGVTVYTFLGKNGIMAKTDEAKFKHKMSAIAEQWKLYVADCVAEDLGQTDIKQLFAGTVGEGVIYDIIADEEIEMDVGLIKDIRKLLNEVTEVEEKFTMAFEGELYYVSRNTIENNAQQVQWCKEIGIKIWEYKGRADTKVVNGDYKNIKRSLPMYAKIGHRICKRKNQVHQRKRWKLSTWNVDY